MQKNNFKYYFLLCIFFLIFCLIFFVPRYLAHLQYDALEDEILSIRNNEKYSISELILAPDFTHPPLWYILMDYPTSIIGLKNGIFYYRLIQVCSLFLIIVFILFVFRKKISHKFIFTFFSLFFSNVYLVHLTMQHRMYSMILGISILYSFYWYSLFKNKNIIASKHFIALALIAAIGFFINYSIVWLIPIWPLSYFLYKKNFASFRNLMIFSFSFFALTFWFAPVFMENAKQSVAANQWTPHLNFINVVQLFGNYFGFIPIEEYLYKINLAFIPFLFLILILIKDIFKKNQLFSRTLSISILILVFGFLITVYFTKNSLLYPRTAISMVIAFYIFISHSLINNKYFKLIFIFLILLQASQFVIYFNQNKNFSKNYYSMNYRENPVNRFKEYNFKKDSCLLVVPYWNVTAARFFLNQKIQILLSDEINSNEATKKMSNCLNTYLLIQTSIEEKILDEQIKAVLKDQYILNFVNGFENQDLYILEKI